MINSSYDRVMRHLESEGGHVSVGADLRENLDNLVRRCDEVRSLGGAYGSVELSPYMRSLMGISSFTVDETPALRTVLVAGQ